ncbi:hypothetical protein C8R45DRAFT_1136384 [Mycena sanguinolenta]|nr:hypothetical protein C8R45DRAFT_1136384 [Mycena sanguinolenta]
MSDRVRRLAVGLGMEMCGRKVRDEVPPVCTFTASLKCTTAAANYQDRCCQGEKAEHRSPRRTSGGPSTKPGFLARTGCTDEATTMKNMVAEIDKSVLFEPLSSPKAAKLDDFEAILIFSWIVSHILITLWVARVANRVRDLERAIIHAYCGSRSSSRVRHEAASSSPDGCSSTESNKIRGRVHPNLARPNIAPGQATSSSKQKRAWGLDDPAAARALDPHAHVVFAVCVDGFILTTLTVLAVGSERLPLKQT